ncbi:glycoside hydrolase family 16 protein [Mariniblastus sp.]|nr:glycoside hydrolase family 16 protein [Mariniblastus sp.]MDB4756885.1 glycoside hydrolase family 16 protein [Mariniblastus sp.]
MTESPPMPTPLSFTIICLLLIGLCTQCRADERPPKEGAEHPTESTYRLVWQDEFAGTKLDRSKWVPEDDTVIGQYGHGNGESQAYVDAEGETFYVKDGRLTIVARHAPGRKYPLKDGPYGKILKEIDHQTFRSAKLRTRKLASFTYGIFEARIKNPTDAAGKKTAIPTWPAFWMLPEEKTAPYRGYWDEAAATKNLKWTYSSWPYSGEIDIMEMSGRATRLYHGGAAYHTSPKNWTAGHIGWYSHYRRFDGRIDPRQWIADQVLDKALQPKAGEDSYSTDYHIYGCKWTKSRIVFMLDHKEWGPSLDLTDKKKFGGKSIYNDYPFFLILNQAIGGNYFGVWGPDDKGPDKKDKNELYEVGLFPQFMNIDWVRVYQQDGK